MPKVRYNDAISWLNLWMLGVLSVLSLWTLPGHPENVLLLGLYLGLGGLLCYRDQISSMSDTAGTWFDRLYPFVYISLIFESLGWLLPYLKPWRADRFLRELDLLMFGVDPTVYLQRYVTPGLVELSSIAYVSYFVLPFFLIVGLYRSGHISELREWGTIVILTLYVNYLLYFLFPAKGPRFFTEYTVELEGLVIRELSKHVINFFEPNKFDVFPSAHVAVSLAVLYGHVRYYKRYIVTVSLFVAGIVFSTVFLRYHYFVDVVAAVLLLFISIPAGHYIYKRFEVEDP